jgi:simple sugar transport system substrate-binding protein/ribose transport system substrate-binding protein
MNFKTKLKGFVVAGMLTAGAPVAAEDTTVAAIVFQQDQFFRTIMMGMNSAADAADVTLLEGNSEGKPDKEITLIDTYIARGVDALIVSPVSAQASIPSLQRAKDAGIVVITYNSTVDDDTIPVSYLNSSQRDLGNSTGQLAAAFIAEKLGGNAQIATLGFQSLLPEIHADRVDGFLEKAEEGNTVEVVSQQDAWLAEDAVRVAGDIITANPGINIIYAANEGGTVGAVQAVRNAGKEGEIFVFGVDGTEQLLSFLLDDDNVLQATTAQQPFVIGEMALQNALTAVAGGEVEHTVLVPVLGLSRNDRATAETFLEGLKALQ